MQQRREVRDLVDAAAGDADADGDDACDAREIVRDSGLLDRPRTCSAISAAVSSLVAGNTITNSSPP